MGARRPSWAITTVPQELRLEIWDYLASGETPTEVERKLQLLARGVGRRTIAAVREELARYPEELVADLPKNVQVYWHELQAKRGDGDKPFTCTADVRHVAEVRRALEALSFRSMAIQEAGAVPPPHGKELPPRGLQAYLMRTPEWLAARVSRGVMTEQVAATIVYSALEHAWADREFRDLSERYIEAWQRAHAQGKVVRGKIKDRWNELLGDRAGRPLGESEEKRFGFDLWGATIEQAERVRLRLPLLEYDLAEVAEGMIVKCGNAGAVGLLEGTGSHQAAAETCESHRTLASEVCRDSDLATLRASLDDLRRLSAALAERLAVLRTRNELPGTCSLAR